MFEASIKGDYKFLKKIKHLSQQVPRRMSGKFAEFVSEGSRENIKDKFTLRNTYTLNSIQSETSSGGARVGSTAPYMAIQEFGGIVRSKTGAHVAIPYPYASRETSYPRKAPVQRRNLFRRVKLPNNRFFIRGRTLFRREGQQIRGVYDIGRTYIYIQKRPWLGPAVDDFEKKLPDIFKKWLLGS